MSLTDVPETIPVSPQLAEKIMEVGRRILAATIEATDGEDLAIVVPALCRVFASWAAVVDLPLDAAFRMITKHHEVITTKTVTFAPPVTPTEKVIG